MHHWCKLIPQATMTLNMLRPCRQNPALSAWEALFGAFSFDATPLAPPGTLTFVHEKPTKRASWAARATQGWYVGPAPNHYHCSISVVAFPQIRRSSHTTATRHPPHGY
mmetsp:Transcript_30567/g.62466  ORF Transcript_30567/g.62466 Transcript_30567/m.62466 type:complete len:109 (-) Transcript_30567:1347-1673(-)